MAREPIHPGEILADELTELGISAAELDTDEYYGKATAIETHLDEAYAAREAGDREKHDATLTRLKLDLLEANTLEGLVTSNLKDLLELEQGHRGMLERPPPADHFKSWPITTADHPIFGAAREGIIEECEQLKSDYDAAYREVVQSLNPLRGESLLELDAYDRMWGWKKTEIRSRLESEIEKIRRQP